MRRFELINGYESSRRYEKLKIYVLNTDEVFDCSVTILVFGKDLVVLSGFSQILNRGNDSFFGVEGVELVPAAVSRINRDWLHNGSLLLGNISWYGSFLREVLSLYKPSGGHFVGVFPKCFFNFFSAAAIDSATLL